MNDQEQKSLREFLVSRHAGLVFGVMILLASIGFPLCIAWVSNLKIESMIDVASKWVGGEYSDGEVFSGSLLLSILSIQTGILFAAFGLGALYSYAYREIKFRSLFQLLNRLATPPSGKE